MNKKFFIVCGILCIVGYAIGESFVIKKTKQIVVGIKDRCMNSICTILDHSAQLNTTQGVLIQSTGTLQKQLMDVVKEEAEGVSRLDLLSPNQLQAIEQHLEKLEKEYKRAEKTLKAATAQTKIIYDLLSAHQLKKH